MKTLSSLSRIFLLAGMLVSLSDLSARAQVASASSGIAAAPANSPQKQILSTALSPETRQTLQQAMDSYAPAPGHTPSGK